MGGVLGFGLPLWIAKTAQYQTATIDEACIGDEDHVRKGLHRLNSLDACTCLFEVGEEVVPLLVCKFGVGSNFLIHPWIDFIKYSEVVRWTHQVGLSPRK